MSDAHQHAPIERHEGPIKTPKQLIVAVVFSFIIPIVVIILLTQFVGAGAKPGAGSDLMAEQAVAQRLAKVGRVEIQDASGPKTLATGEQVYTAQCAGCHAAGTLGAPKLGDSAAWSARLGQGYEALLNSALKGKGAMAAQGGGNYSDVEVGRAVVYMANKAGGNLAEPKAPEAAGSAAAAGAAPALYTQACGACHEAGVAGAPKHGDKAAWSARLAAGVDGLTKSVIAGKGAMPPRGASTGTDDEIKAAVSYLVDAVK